MVVFKGVLYDGKHDPLITKELFDLTQLAFRKDNKPKHITAREFLFSGMVKCANCGCNISGEIKKGKYIYYSCTGGKGECKQQHIYIPEIKLEKQIIEAMGEIYITQEHKQWMERHNSWTQALLTVQNNINAYERANIDFIEEGAKFLKICNEVKDLYLYGTYKERKELINYVLQNLTIEGENIHYDYKKPFDIFAKGLNRNKKLPRLDSNQQPTG